MKEKKSMAKVLVIGCGGVASVAIQKCCMNSEVFTDICIASRTVEKCEALKAKLEGKTNTKISTAKVNADSVEELVALISSYKTTFIWTLPPINISIMEACLRCR